MKDKSKKQKSDYKGNFSVLATGICKKHGDYTISVREEIRQEKNEHSCPKCAQNKFLDQRKQTV